MWKICYCFQLQKFSLLHNHILVESIFQEDLLNELFAELKTESGSKPQWRIVQTDDTMTLQWYTAVIPGTHSELLQEASTDEFHKIESGSIQDSTVKEWEGR